MHRVPHSTTLSAVGVDFPVLEDDKDVSENVDKVDEEHHSVPDVVSVAATALLLKSTTLPASGKLRHYGSTAISWVS